MPAAMSDALLGFLAAAVPGAGAWYATRQSFTGKIMDMVEKRCAALELEVEECRDRDKLTGARIVFLEGSIRMALPELARLDPRNLVLAQVTHALKALPESTPEWQAMLLELDRKTPGLVWEGGRYSSQSVNGEAKAEG